MALETERLTNATAAFLRMLHREHARRFPDRTNPVPHLDLMRPIDKVSWMRCVQAALEADEIRSKSTT